MNSLLEKCNKLGLKMTEQRRVITQVLSDSKIILMWSLFIRELKIDKNIGIATVYWTIKLFEKIILLKNMNLKMEDLVGEVPAEHHDHLLI